MSSCIKANLCKASMSSGLTGTYSTSRCQSSSTLYQKLNLKALLKEDMKFSSRKAALLNMPTGIVG
jgi:hypothetical protein